MAARPTAFLAVAVLVAIAVAPRVALGDDPACAVAVHAWVARASRDASLDASAVACPPGRIRVRLRPRGSSALDVEVLDHATNAFRRVGTTGVSPILDVVDWSAVPTPQRDAFEGLVAWMSANASDIAFGTAGRDPQVARALQPLGPRRTLPWILPLALAFALLARSRGRAFARTDVRIAWALVGVSLVLRFATGAWGPFHINGQGPFWILAAVDRPDEIATSGPGFVDMYHWLAARFPTRPDHAIFAANGVLSALTVPLTFALARLAGVDSSRAAGVALLMLVDPVVNRFAVTESYFVPIIALVVAAAVSSMACVAEVRSRRWIPAAALASAAILFAGEASRIHPIAWSSLLLVPIWAASTHTDPSFSLGGRVVVAIVSTVVIGAAVVALSGSGLGDIFAATRSNQISAPSLRGSGRIIATALTAAVVLAAIARPRPVLVPALIAIVIALAWRNGFRQSELWQDSFLRLFRWSVLPAVVACVPARWVTRRAIRIGLAVGATLGVVVCASASRVRTTEQREYVWLRGVLERTPRGCRVVHLRSAGRRVYRVPSYVISGAGDRATMRVEPGQPLDPDRTFRADGCVWFVHGSICSSVEGRPHCAEIERGFALREIASAEFPARASIDSLPFDRQTVRVAVLERVHRPGR